MAQETGRRLAAVMFTDMVGYSALTERNEKLALELLNEHQRILRQIFPSFGGIEIKNTGDGFFCEFASILDAVNCAVAIQTTLFERGLSVDDDRKFQIRIGLHLGDILDFEQDRYGTEVNIAARIEPFAQPGGICISHQVYDQIASKTDLPVRKLGKVRLKNIQDPLALYRIILPWEARGPGFFRRAFKHLFPDGAKTPQGVLLGVQVAGVLGILAFVLLKLWHPVTLTVDRAPIRSIASFFSAEAPVRKQLLPKDWQYALAADSDSSTRWRSFDVSNTPLYADELEGDYLLKLDFIGDGGFRHPAIILGLISDVHRVYFNGKFIGGSERFSDLGVYSFDPSFMKPGEQNTILIKAHTRQSFSPGINLLPGLAPKIGEYEDVSREWIRNQVSFHLLRPVSLAISLLLAFASLCYYLIRRSDLKYLYFSCFLFLGSLCLTYYNTFVVASVSYPFYRFMKLLSLGLSSFVLFSLYLNLRRLKRLETANNFSALLFGFCSAALLLGHSILPSLYIARYNTVLTAVVVYTLVWLGLLAVRGALKFSKPVELYTITRTQIVDVTLVVGFGLAVAVICYTSIIQGEQPGIFGSYMLKTQIKNVALLYPFAFALMVLVTGVADHTRKSRDISYKRRKDDLILSVANLAANGSDTAETISAIQSRVAEFLKASRSTIYLSQNEMAQADESKGFLKATYIHGPVGAKERIKKVIQPSSGIIGYCIEHRSPVFVEDIAKDPRFSAFRSPGYRTGSFMVFPLLLGSRLQGVITIADRLDGKPFTREDFGLMYLVAKDLAFLISHTQLREKLHERAA